MTDRQKEFPLEDSTPYVEVKKLNDAVDCYDKKDQVIFLLSYFYQNLSNCSFNLFSANTRCGGQ